MMQRILSRIQTASKVQWYVLFLVLAAFFTRFYNLENTVQFLGDQGRDALVVSRIFTDSDPVFIGPVTSVGNMYLGPLYYYYMLPFLWLSYPSPMGPVYAVAGLGVLTVYFMYFLGKELVGQKAALIAATLYTFSATITGLTRFSWNPNPAPLVALLMLWSLHRAITRSPWYWVAVTLCFTVLAQLHYITLLSGLSFGIIWIARVVVLMRSKDSQKKTFELKHTLLATLVSVGVVLASLVPLVLFDWKHNWLNATAFGNLLFGENNFGASGAEGSRLIQALAESEGRAMHLLFEITIGQVRNLNEFLLAVVAGSIGYLSLQWKKRPHKLGEGIILVFLAVGIAGTAMYQHSVFDHYIAYLFPVTFLLFGVLFSELLRHKRVGTLLFVVALGYFFWYNLPKLPLGSTGWKLSDIARTSAAIAERVEDGEKYNLVLLSETGDIDGQNYRYFLSTTQNPPVLTQDRGSIETLFIINEDRVLRRVVDSPVYEIVVFPQKEPSEVFEIPGGPEITVLRKQN